MLKDVTKNDEFLGGKILIFCGYPRQMLPVSPKGSRSVVNEGIVNEVPTNLGICYQIKFNDKHETEIILLQYHSQNLYWILVRTIQQFRQNLIYLMILKSSKKNVL